MVTSTKTMLGTPAGTLQDAREVDRIFAGVHTESNRQYAKSAAVGKLVPEISTSMFSVNGPTAVDKLLIDGSENTEKVLGENTSTVEPSVVTETLYVPMAV